MTVTQRQIEAENAARNAPRCHKCAQSEPAVDLVHCTHLTCDRAVCCDCASEVEWEMEACAEHARAVFVDLRDAYRNALRRATMPATREGRAA